MQLAQRLGWGAHGGSFLEAVRAASPLRRVAVPTLAGLLIVAARLVSKQPIGGHGTAGIIEAIWLRKGRLRFGWSVFRGTLSIIAVALGAPLGREGALIQTGAATGSLLGRRLGIPEDQVRILVAAGGAAGIAAAYNVPIGAALFGLEVLLGSFALELFGPIVLCCVVATLISRTLVANHPSYLVPHYVLTRPREIILGAAFAPLLGALSVLYVRTVDGLPSVFDRVPRLRTFLPPVALLATGALALRFPDILGNGYDSVNATLFGSMPLVLLLVLPFIKMAVTALCAGVGVPGGLFTPTLFFGALLGGAFGLLAHRVWPTEAPSGAYALLGMGAVLAGTTHAPISTVLIIFELTGDYDVILPLMLASAIAAGTSRLFGPDSIYTATLRRRSVLLPEPPRPHWLSALRAKDVMVPGARTILATAPFEDVVLALLELPPSEDLYVIDQTGAYQGAIVLDALKGHLPDRQLLPMIIACDVMDRAVMALADEMPLSQITARLGETSLDKLPVVEAQSRRVVGVVSKTELLRRRRY
jgi:CIC family chloride channel protein